MTTEAPTLSVVVTTAGRREHLRTVVDQLTAMHDTGAVEVVAVFGGGTDALPNGAPDSPATAGVRWLQIPQCDVFAARAAGAAGARGTYVALVEDHADIDPTWAAQLVAAWHQHPEADGLVHTVRLNPRAGAWEAALFSMVFGPFMGTPVANERLPVPGQISFRRSLLPAGELTPGWLEYDLMRALVLGDRLAYVDVTAPLHVQPVTWRAPVLAFHAGRAYAGCELRDHAVGRVAALRRMRNEVPQLVRETLAGRRRTTGGVLGRRYALAITVVLGGHTLGQLLGVVTRSPGNSTAALE